MRYTTFEKSARQLVSDLEQTKSRSFLEQYLVKDKVECCPGCKAINHVNKYFINPEAYTELQEVNGRPISKTFKVIDPSNPNFLCITCLQEFKEFILVDYFVWQKTDCYETAIRIERENIMDTITKRLSQEDMAFDLIEKSKH